MKHKDLLPLSTILQRIYAESCTRYFNINIYPEFKSKINEIYLKISSITADNVDVYKDAVSKMSDSMDANIKVLFLLFPRFSNKIFEITMYLYITEHVHDCSKSRRSNASNEIGSSSFSTSVSFKYNFYKNINKLVCFLNIIYSKEIRRLVDLFESYL